MPFSGILPSQSIAELIETGAISAANPSLLGRCSPRASTCGLARGIPRAGELHAGAGATTAEQIERFVLHTIDLSHGAVLETGCVYVAEVEEQLALPPDVRGFANPKSSTGRLDVFTRMIADHAPGFDQTVLAIAAAFIWKFARRPSRSWCGPARGSRKSAFAAQQGMSHAGDQPRARRCFPWTSRGGGPSALIGYRAKRHTGVIDVDRVGAYDVEEFWEPLLVTPQKRLILDPDEFYILASKESGERAAQPMRRRWSRSTR